MKRRDVVRALLTPEPGGLPPERPADKGPRVVSHAVRAMGLELNRLADEANQASQLRDQLASGTAVVDLDAGLIDGSFVSDRLTPTDDADYRRLLASMRQSGQQVPILVRPHPEKEGRYQVAYGHRRWRAATELGVPVKAIVRSLSDDELVVAQGKENSERRNLSFIERALFAAHLQARGFDRPTLNAALGVQSAEMTRLLAVAAAVPADLVRAIGPAPKAGRPRWLELADHLSHPDAAAAVAEKVQEPAFRRLATDARFEALILLLRDRAGQSAEEVLRNSRGEGVLRIARAGKETRLVADERLAPGLGTFLIARLPELLQRFEEETRR